MILCAGMTSTRQPGDKMTSLRLLEWNPPIQLTRIFRIRSRRVLHDAPAPRKGEYTGNERFTLGH